jgi:hypothetical protein
MVMQYYVPGAGTTGDFQTSDEVTEPLWQTIQRQQLDPYSAYRATALGTLRPQGMYAPRFEQAAMRGFSPALGGYMLSQSNLPFSEYLANQQGAPTVQSQPVAAQNWADYVAASRGYTGEEGVYRDPTTGADFAPATWMQGTLQNENAQRYAMDMARSMMGGPTRGFLGDLTTQGLRGQQTRYNRMLADPTSPYFGGQEAGFAGWLAGRGIPGL